MLNVKENSFLYINIIYLNRFCNPELKSYIFVFHSFSVFWSIILQYIIHRDWHSADLVTMAGRGRMKLCILQVLCMYFSVTVIFIFRSWSKTQKLAFYIYISWNISYSSYFKRNVEGQICCCCALSTIWTSVLIKLFVFCRAPSPPIYTCFLFLQIIASFVIGVNCMFCNSKNHKQEEQSVLLYCVTYINDCILIHCWLANKKKLIGVKPNELKAYRKNKIESTRTLFISQRIVSYMYLKLNCFQIKITIRHTTSIINSLHIRLVRKKTKKQNKTIFDTNIFVIFEVVYLLFIWSFYFSDILTLWHSSQAQGHVPGHGLVKEEIPIQCPNVDDKMNNARISILYTSGVLNQNPDYSVALLYQTEECYKVMLIQKF